MRVFGNRGATTSYVDPSRIFPNGLWILQTIIQEFEPEKPVKPILHFSGTAVTREHGPKVEAHQDSYLTGGIVRGLIAR